MDTMETGEESMTTHSAAAVRDWLIGYVAQLLGIERSDVDPARNLERYGLDSSAAVGMSGDLSDLIGRDLDVSIASEFPTIDELVGHLVAVDAVRAE